MNASSHAYWTTDNAYSVTGHHRIFVSSRLTLVAGLLGAIVVPRDSLANNVLWSNTTGNTAWLTDTNWTGTARPTTADVAQFGANPASTSAGIGIDAATSSDVGVGAVQVLSTRSGKLFVGNGASVDGTLTLFGRTVNGTSDVVLQNDSASALTIQNTQGGGTRTLGVVLGDAVTNVFRTTGTGGLSVSSAVSGVGRSVTIIGSATSGAVTLDAANPYTGGTTVASGKLLANGAFGFDGTTLVASATGTGLVAVHGGVLAGSGSVATVEIDSGGTVSAGSGATSDDSTFTLTSGAQAWHAGGTYAWKVSNSAGVAGGPIGWDLLTMTSLDLSTLGGGGTFTIKPLLARNGVFDATKAKRFQIAAVGTGVALGPNWADRFTLDPSGLGLPASRFSISTGPTASGFALYVDYVPEPSLLSLLAAASMLARRRRTPMLR